MADFILTRRRREYKQKDKYPIVRIRGETYQKLQSVALEADRSIMDVADLAIQHALGELKWVEEQ